MLGKKGRRRPQLARTRNTVWHFVVHFNGSARTIGTAASVRKQRALREARRLGRQLGARVGVSPQPMGTPARVIVDRNGVQRITLAVA